MNVRARRVSTASVALVPLLIGEQAVASERGARPTLLSVQVAP